MIYPADFSGPETFSANAIPYTQHIASIFLIVNQPSGNGRTADELNALQKAFFHCFEPIAQPTFSIATDHKDVTRQTRTFLTAFPGPWLLIAGGGSGTQRAVIQGVMAEVEKGEVALVSVSLSGLRLGSGNIIPRHLGVATDAVTALRHIAAGVGHGRRQLCCLYRCDCYHDNGQVDSIYGLTMAGLGQFGRVPGDVRRWRERHPRLMQWACRRWPREKVNTVQYFSAIFRRAMACLAQPRQTEAVVIYHNGRWEQMRLFAGLLINFDFAQLPFNTGCTIDEPCLALCLLPWNGRRHMLAALRQWRHLDDVICRYDVTPGRPVTIQFLPGKQTVLALDEDTFIVPSCLRFSVAGLIPYVTGSPSLG